MQKTCKPLLELFNNSDTDFDLFMYDPNESIIFINKQCKTDKKLHEQLFMELALLTDKLNSLNCDYSIDTNGDILLNCKSQNYACDVIQSTTF